MSKSTGTQTHFEYAAPRVKNRKLVTDYYARRAASTKPEKRVDNRRASETDLLRIAEYLRQHSKTATVRDLHVSWPLVEFVSGEMALGRLGGF